MNEIEQNISFACKKPFKIIKTIKENRVYIVEVETETLIYKQEQLPRVVDAIFFQKKCAESGILSPEIKEYGKLNEEFGFILMEFVKGCDDELNSELRKDNTFWLELSNGVKNIHKIPIDGFGFNISKKFDSTNFTSHDFHNCLDIVLKQIIADIHGHPEQDIAIKLHSKILLLENHKQAWLSHGDLGGNNFLWNSSAKLLYFFDAGYLRGMPHTWDLAYFGWRISEDRVTEHDYDTLEKLLYPNGLDTKELYEIQFFKVLTGLFKIKDGILENNKNLKHVEVTRENFNTLLELE